MIEAKALLFDLDGTLIDSVSSGTRCWHRWAEEFGVDPARLADIHGRRSAETVALLLPEQQGAQALARIDELEIDDAVNVRPLPGAAELLASLPTDIWGIVTSCSAGLAAARIAGAGLPAPPLLVTAGDVTRGKPDPEPYLFAAAKLGVEPGQCAGVEDTPRGISSVRAAGMAVVAIAPPHADGLDADLVVETPGHLHVAGTDPMLVASRSGDRRR